MSSVGAESNNNGVHISLKKKKNRRQKFLHDDRNQNNSLEQNSGKRWVLGVLTDPVFSQRLPPSFWHISCRTFPVVHVLSQPETPLICHQDKNNYLKTPILYSFLSLWVNHLAVFPYCQNFWSALTTSKYNHLTMSVLC